ncbi:hypothetical protein K438DRAFT_1767129 [Mycena galopus ATCC 62051]|nr:hypothetical protein K438DRAFT_1767129 [Mycena galopus ATCC 62051]
MPGTDIEPTARQLKFGETFRNVWKRKRLEPYWRKEPAVAKLGTAVPLIDGTCWRIYKMAESASFDRARLGSARLLCVPCDATTIYGLSSDHHAPSPDTLNASLIPFIPSLQVRPNVEDLHSSISNLDHVHQAEIRASPDAPAIWYNIPVGTEWFVLDLGSNTVGWLEKIEVRSV